MRPSHATKGPIIGLSVSGGPALTIDCQTLVVFGACETALENVERHVSIVRTVVNGPIIVVADEPTGHRDRNSAGNVLDALERVNTQVGHTILRVTHDRAAAKRAKIIRRLDNGRLVS